MSDAKQPLTQGVILALDRDRAKQLFGAKQPTEMHEFLAAQIEDPAVWQPGTAANLQGLATEMQLALSDESIGANELRPALDATLLGGRPLLDDGTLEVRVVRPDLVLHVSAALETIRDSAVADCQAVAGIDPDRVTGLLSQIREIYRQAAASRAAIVIARETD